MTASFQILSKLFFTKYPTIDAKGLYVQPRKINHQNNRLLSTIITNITVEINDMTKFAKLLFKHLYLRRESHVIVTENFIFIVSLGRGKGTH